MIDINNCFTYAYSNGTYTDFYETITTDSDSTNYIDLDVAGIRISGGTRPPWLIVRVGTIFASIVSLNIRLQTDSATGFSTTLRDIGQWRFARAQMTAGTLLVNQPLPHLDFQRYLRLYWDVFTTATTGTMLAYLAAGPEPAVTDVDQVEAAS